MSPHKRGPWSPGEDSYLLQLVQSQGAHNWVRISHLIGSRSPKQCRERYHQNLKPTLNHEPITPDEGIVIEKLVGEMGKRWAEIARRLNGRSDNAVKNWWNGGMNRRRRLVHRRGDPARAGRQFDERLEPLSFARPVNHQDNPTRTTMVSSLRRHPFDTPLPSPSGMSEVSRADSADGVPSLMSDSASNFSTSPRFPQSPAIELPPLIGNRANDRRPSWPMVHLGANGYALESDMQMPSFVAARPEVERKFLQPHTPQQHGVFRRPSLPAVMPREESNSLRQPVASFPSMGCQLPVFQPPTGLSAPAEQAQPMGGVEPVQRAETKDRRMNVSNLLG